MAVAVGMAKYLGATRLAVPSAGNAAGALAAYAARAGLPAYLFMPKDALHANIIECQTMGAHVTLVDGLITDCGREVALRKKKRAGSISQRSRNRIELKARKRWAMRSPNSSNGNCLM